MATQPEDNAPLDQMEAFIAETVPEAGLSDEDYAVLMGQQEPKAEEPAAEETPPSPEPGTPAPVPAAPEGAVPPPEATPAQPPSTEDLLRSQLAALTAQMTELQARFQAPAQPQPGAPVPQATQPTPEEPAVPAYLYQIPDTLLDALESDNRQQRSMAMTHLLSQIAQKVHATLRQETREFVSTRFESYDQQIAATRAQEEIRKDYYSAFPQHNKKEIQPLIAAVSQQVMREQGSTAWTEEVRNAVGARVNALLGAQQGGAPAATPTSSAPAAPPPLVTSTGRPAAPAQQSNDARLIAETFD